MAHPTRIFKEPKDLRIAWDEFKVDLERQKEEWYKTHFVGKEGHEVKERFKIPMTLEGFKRFARNNYGCVEQYFTNQDDCYDDFIGICRAIKEEIRENQIIGGMVGLFNPSITQRLNNLTDKKELTGNLKVEQITGMSIE